MLMNTVMFASWAVRAVLFENVGATCPVGAAVQECFKGFRPVQPEVLFN